MNRRILTSILVIGVVGAFATGSTLALFNDTETSEENTFTAGAIDLGIDVDGGPYDGSIVYGQGEDSPTVPTFFNYGTDEGQGPDIKPGDVHERTLSFHVDNNPAWVCGVVHNTQNLENDITEPESDVDNTPNEGELAQMSDLHIWSDGIEGETPNAGNNEFNPDADEDNSVVGPERELPTEATAWAIADSTTNIYGDSGPLEGEKTYYMGVEYSLPIEVGNEAQTDSYQADVTFYAEQARNNPDFECSTDIVGEETDGPISVTATDEDGTFEANEGDEVVRLDQNVSQTGITVELFGIENNQQTTSLLDTLTLGTDENVWVETDLSFGDEVTSVRVNGTTEANAVSLSNEASLEGTASPANTAFDYEPLN